MTGPLKLRGDRGYLRQLESSHTSAQNHARFNLFARHFFFFRYNRRLVGWSLIARSINGSPRFSLRLFPGGWAEKSTCREKKETARDRQGRNDSIHSPTMTAGRNCCKRMIRANLSPTICGTSGPQKYQLSGWPRSSANRAIKRFCSEKLLSSSIQRVPPRG